MARQIQRLKPKRKGPDRPQPVIVLVRGDNNLITVIQGSESKPGLTFTARLIGLIKFVIKMLHSK